MIKRRPNNQPPPPPRVNPPTATREVPTPTKVTSPHNIKVVLPKQELCQYEFIPERRQWSVLVLAVAFLSQCRQGFKNLLQQIQNGALSLLICTPSSIPRMMRQRYTSQRLLDILIKLHARLEEATANRTHTLLNILLEQPQTEFSVNILVRALMLETAKTAVNYCPTDYLGNELDILRDFSSSFEYKLFKIASISFKMNIEIVFIHGNSQHVEVYSEEDFFVDLAIVKKNQSVQFKVSQNIFLNSTHLSTESSIKEKFRLQSNDKTEIRNETKAGHQRLQRTLNRNEKGKDKVLEKDKSQRDVVKDKIQEKSERTQRDPRNKTPEQPPVRDKSTGKCCPKCGQTRKPEQKFCSCRKHIVRAPLKQ